MFLKEDLSELSAFLEITLEIANIFSFVKKQKLRSIFSKIWQLFKNSKTQIHPTKLRNELPYKEIIFNVYKNGAF